MNSELLYVILGAPCMFALSTASKFITDFSEKTTAYKQNHAEIINLFTTDKLPEQIFSSDNSVVGNTTEYAVIHSEI